MRIRRSQQRRRLEWTHKTYPALSGDDGMVPLKEEMDFSKEAVSVSNARVAVLLYLRLWSDWAGPFRLNIQGRPFDDDHIESHTCYLVTGAKEGYFFLGSSRRGLRTSSIVPGQPTAARAFRFLGGYRHLSKKPRSTSAGLFIRRLRFRRVTSSRCFAGRSTKAAARSRGSTGSMHMSQRRRQDVAPFEQDC